jgi:tetratricopeptide (TPR) repeat protein
MRLPLAVSTALVLACLSWAPTPSHASPASSAALLVSQGKQKEADGEELTALKRYGDALAMDPSSEEAYLALGALRTRRGELSEADEVYSLALKRIPSSFDALLGRAHSRRLWGRHPSAGEDLLHALAMVGNVGTPREIAVLRELVALKREQKEPAAELGAWRRLLSIGKQAGDAALTKEASLQVRALGIFVGDVDPALRGRTDKDLDRRTFAAIARRGG